MRISEMKYFTKSMRLSNTTGLLGIRNSILQNEKLIEEQPNGDFKFTVVFTVIIFIPLYLCKIYILYQNTSVIDYVL